MNYVLLQVVLIVESFAISLLICRQCLVTAEISGSGAASRGWEKV